MRELETSRDQMSTKRELAISSLELKLLDALAHFTFLFCNQYLIFFLIHSNPRSTDIGVGRRCQYVHHLPVQNLLILSPLKPRSSQHGSVQRNSNLGKIYPLIWMWPFLVDVLYLTIQCCLGRHRSNHVHLRVVSKKPPDLVTISYLEWPNIPLA